MAGDPWMYEEVIDTGSLFLVLDQTLSNEVNTVLSAILEYLLFELGLFVKYGIVEF